MPLIYKILDFIRLTTTKPIRHTLSVWSSLVSSTSSVHSLCFVLLFLYHFVCIAFELWFISIWIRKYNIEWHFFFLLSLRLFNLCALNANMLSSACLFLNYSLVFINRMLGDRPGIKYVLHAHTKFISNETNKRQIFSFVIERQRMNDGKTTK